MAWTQADLDAVDTALRSNVRRVRFADGRETEYRTASEMLEVRRAIKEQLAADASQTSRNTRTTIGRLRRY